MIRLSLFLSGPQSTILLRQIKEEATGLVKEAKSLIEKHFSNLFENENAQSILEQVTEEEQGAGESLVDEVIRSIQYYLIWEDYPPELTPAVRMGFKNRKKKILLNTKLDWDECSFLLKTLSKILIKLFEKGKPLAELGQIDLSGSENVLKNIDEALGNLQKMKSIMPVYKGKKKTEKNKQSVKDSSSKK